MTSFLCTTALEETWHGDEALLFLGEWCRRYSRRQHWSKLDAQVLPYHWDDRTKLYRDYQYLREFHERLLREMAVQLNQIHGVDHGLRYWRILVGPWTGFFVQMLFDRWTSIHQAIGQYELSGTIVLCGDERSLLPNDMVDFTHLFSTDEWNHHVYAMILKQFTQIHCHTRQHKNQPARTRLVEAASWQQWIKRNLRNRYGRIASVMTGGRDAFLLDTYLPPIDEMRLHLRLGQFPQLWRYLPAVRAAADARQRQWTLSGENQCEFEACARQLIAQQIPVVYLEGYRQLVEQTQRLPWPKHPKVVFTSSAHRSDDVFKAWAADQAERGSPLVIGQHGGHYGTGLWCFAEEHDIEISDRYLSWGWSDPSQGKVYPVGELKSKRPLGIRHAQQTHALMVCNVLSRFSYWMYSMCVAGQWLDYFHNQCVFVGHLPTRIQQALIVRLNSEDYGWDQIGRWRDRFPELHLDPGVVGIDDLVRRSRLYISTYNATTYLESFTMNVPTVIYWNEDQSELRESAHPYFEDLKRVGIFHSTAQSAAHHVAAIWDDVDAWWSSAPVQEVLRRFKRRYCDLPNDLLNRVEYALRDVATANEPVR